MTGVLLFAFPAALKNSWERWSNPFSPVERYTFVNLADLPDEKYVPYGESFEIAVKLTADSYWKPDSASARCGNQSRIEADIVDDMAIFKIPGQTKKVLLQFQIGDAQESTQIIPLHRPELTALEAELTYPEYLHYPTKKLNLKTGNTALDMLEGSRLVFKGAVSRALESVDIQKGSETIPLQVKKNQFESTILSIKADEKLLFDWIDTYGFSSSTPYTLNFNLEKDGAPWILFPELEDYVQVLEDSVLEIDVHGHDDYGIKSLAIKWAVESTQKNEDEAEAKILNLKKGELLTKTGDYQLKLLEGTAYFSPRQLEIMPSSLVNLQGVVVDYYPGRIPVKSKIFRIYVMSREEHGRWIGEKIIEVSGKMIEVMRGEENSKEKTENLSKLPDNKITKADGEIGEQKEREESHAAKIDEIKEDLKEVMHEGLKNEDFPKNLLTDLAEVMDNLDQVSKQEMKNIQQNLENAQSSSQSNERREKLEETEGEQEKVINKLKNMAKKLNEMQDKAQARTFVMRLRNLSSKEGIIASELQQNLDKLIGANPDQAVGLSNRVKLHKAVISGAVEIEDDLKSFFERTLEKKYSKVYNAMKDMKMEDGLETLQKHLEKNYVFQSLRDSQKWTKQFEEWASWLEEKKDSEDGGGGQQGDPNENDIEILLDLMEILVGEQKLRDQTRALEESQ